VTTAWLLANQRCFNPNAAVMRAEALLPKEGHGGVVAFSRQATLLPAIFGDQEVR